MEVIPSTNTCSDDDTKNLGQLLEAFGSMVSLGDIASAYCQAGRNLVVAADILSKLKGSASGTSSSKSKDLSNNFSKDCQIPKSKPEKCYASLGTVAGVIGREYMRPRSVVNEASQRTKPVKLNSNDFPVSGLWEEKEESDSTTGSETMHEDIEEFLFEMLGHGFQLDRGVIHDVVGQCGYDMNKSMDKLLDISTSALASNIVDSNNQKGPPENLPNLEHLPNVDYAIRSNADVQDENNLQPIRKKASSEEILQALFCAPGRSEEQVRNHTIREHRRMPHRQVVAKPLEEEIVENQTFITKQRFSESNEDDASNYNELRKAVSEYLVAMREYYKAAAEAYIKKDQAKARKLQEKGRFFMEKAREADEKSAKMLTETSDDKEIYIYHMNYFEPKEAIEFVKFHLASISGISDIPYLKIIIGTEAEDPAEKTRKRLIIRLLQKESIPWTEEGDGKIISIPADEINPENLSFALSVNCQ